MWLYLAVILFWLVTVLGAWYAVKAWRQRLFLTPARSLAQIIRPEYFRRLSTSQFEFLLMQGLRAHGFSFLGDPFLGRASEQGYAWRKGKKAVVVFHPQSSLSSSELDDISRKRRAARAEQALVFSLIAKAPKAAGSGVEVLAGKKLLHWFAILENVTPPIVSRTRAEVCECGAPMKERVSRAGLPLLVCSMYPDCRATRQPQVATSEPPRFSGRVPPLTA